MSGKQILVGVGCLVLLAGLATGAYLLWPEPEPVVPAPSEQAPVEVAKYMASPEFDKLDPATKDEYLDGVAREFDGPDLWEAQREKLTEEEQGRLRQNARPLFRKMMTARIEKYFELPPKEQTAYMDRMIDQMAAMRGAAMARRREEPREEPARQPERERPRRGHGFTPQRIRERIETTPPEQRARFVEFMRAFRKRMEERGIRGGRPHG